MKTLPIRKSLMPVSRCSWSNLCTLASKVNRVMQTSTAGGKHKNDSRTVLCLPEMRFNKKHIRRRQFASAERGASLLIAERRRLQHDEAVGEERSQDRPHAKVACSIGHQLRLLAHPMVRGLELNDEGFVWRRWQQR
jgi:hypothetical protein